MNDIQLRTKEEQAQDCLEMAKMAEAVLGKPCSICYRRGHTGWNESYGAYMLCKCILKAGEIARKQKRKVPHEILPEESN